jgi:hypothetical protein
MSSPKLLARRARGLPGTLPDRLIHHTPGMRTRSPPMRSAVGGATLLGACHMIDVGGDRLCSSQIAYSFQRCVVDRHWRRLAAEILKLHYETLSPSTTVRMACFENIATRLTGAGKGLHLIDFWMNPPFPGSEVTIRQAPRDSGDQLRDESLKQIGDAIDVCGRP